MAGDPSFPHMDGSGGFPMGPPSMAGTPGPGAFGPGAGTFGSAGGFPGQGFGGPQSTYALPSGLGAASSPYPPMNSGYSQTAGMHSGGFDSRAEAAFSSAGHQNSRSSFSNGGGLYSGGAADAADPFTFLSSGIGGLSMGGDESRRNGANSTSKSPA